jgi:deoxyadenosine/deoxycytidine kinase
LRGERRPRACYVAGEFDQGEQAFEIERLLAELGYETRFLYEDDITLPTNVHAVDEANLVIVRLDRNDPSHEACIAAGIAHGRGTPCIGLAASGHVGGGSRAMDGILEDKIAHSLDELRAMLLGEDVIIDLRSTDGEATVDLRRRGRSYAVVSGPLGVGKTTLIDRMASTGFWTVLPEPVMDNPYLAKVYADLPDYAFRNQAFYLGQRAALHNAARNMPGAIVQERCLSEDAEVFNQVMHDQGAINDDDLETLTVLYRGLIENAPRPDVLLYLTAPFEVTLERIRRRDRIGESDLDVDFLRSVYDRYELWAEMPKPIPVLRIDTDESDYLHRPEDAAEIMRRLGGLRSGILVRS